MLKQSTYCSLSTSSWDDRSKKMCCFAKLPSFKNFQEMRQDQKVKDLVNDLKNGVKNPVCDKCWTAENNNLLSMRQQSLQNEGQNKTQSFLEQEAEGKKLKYLALDTGTQCNFACRTCGPWSSTGHRKEWQEKHGQEWQTTSVDFNRVLEQDLSHIKNIEVLGGEPFVNTEHLKVLEKVYNNDPYWLTYTTNGSVKLGKKIMDKFTKFKAVNICLSIDAIGKPFEYIRTLGKWQQVENNINLLLQQKETYKNLSLNCHVTLSALNVLYQRELLDWFDSKKLKYDFTYCYSPAEYSFNIFTDKEKQFITKELNNNSRYKTIINYLEDSNYNENDRNTFIKSVNFTKSFRKLDLKEYLPKLYSLIM